ncbi:KRF2 protein, partial [Notiomystis cincta]|nr:KRF2 protein [Notiomystis cincta]
PCYQPCPPCYQPCFPRSQAYPPYYQPYGPTPLANSCSEPSVREGQSSTVIIQPSPIVVTLPGPILSSFPQN